MGAGAYLQPRQPARAGAPPDARDVELRVARARRARRRPDGEPAATARGGGAGRGTTRLPRAARRARGCVGRAARHTSPPCPQPSSSARSGVTRARARSSTCSPSTPTSSAATRAAPTPATRSSSVARRTRSAPLPSGIVRGKPCVIGNGCVVDPEVLITELDEFERRGHRIDEVYVSGNAHLIMPWHVAIDQAQRAAARPAADRHDQARDRPALRRQGDRASASACRTSSTPRSSARRSRSRSPRRTSGSSASTRRRAVRPRGDRRPLRGATRAGCGLRRRHLAHRRRRTARGQAVLFEGAQATLLDLDHGTYPFVTSSNPVASSAATGVGIGPTDRPCARRRQGLRDARRRRAVPDRDRGRRPGQDARVGGEYGTVTGRERRCGWLDLVALRYAVRVNGITRLR